MKTFDEKDIKKLYSPAKDSSGEENGQVTIIGGSKLFHGAPLFSLKTASRIVDMVFFASPDPSVGKVAGLLKSKLSSFVWIPWEERQDYIQKSDSVLIGPGFMSFRSEKDKSLVRRTRGITKSLLEKFPKKKWVIDAGSLQVMRADWIPRGSILTPNQKEYKVLFSKMNVSEAAKKYQCTIVLKGPETIVCSPQESVKVTNGNPGLTKGGTGDVLAGLTVGLFAKNSAFLAASAASFLEKKAADDLFSKKNTWYNADDLAEQIPKTYFLSLKNN